MTSLRRFTNRVYSTSWIVISKWRRPTTCSFATSSDVTTSDAITGLKNNYDVQIVEVGPRDGLQNERAVVCTKDKVRLIQLLMNAGCGKIEVGSFVSNKAVPTMANTHQVIQQLPDVTMRQKKSSRNNSSRSNNNINNDVRFSALVPTLRYLSDACIYRDTIDEIAIFASASESFSQTNLNCSIDESMIRFEEIMQINKDIQFPVRGYLSCAIGCPYDGMTSSKRVAELTERLLSLGCYEVALSDTIGIGTSKSTKCMIDDALLAVGGQSNLLAVHFHDTYGQALSNIMISLERGITTIDSSIAGLGGCPYAKGATGNVATEDVVYMLHGMDITTGIDIEQLVTASEFICDILKRPSNSKAGIAIAAKRQQENEEENM